MDNLSSAPANYIAPAPVSSPPPAAPAATPASSPMGQTPGYPPTNFVPPPVSTSGVKITTYTGSGKSLRGLIKLALLILLPIGLAVGGALTVSRYIFETTYKQTKGVLLVVPMKDTNWADLGVVFEPLVSLPVKTTTGYQTNQFLLDSGAVVSSLPREWATKTGQDLAFLPRSTFRGFGSTTSFAYQGEMMVMLGEQEFKLPVVFTEANTTKSLLGRKGFFETYSIYFNHKEKQIEIRE